MPAELKKNNPRPSKGGAGMDNEVGALVVGLLEYKKHHILDKRGGSGRCRCIPAEFQKTTPNPREEGRAWRMR